MSVKNEIGYLNTDLELISASDLTPLVSVFEASNLCKLHCAQYDNFWYAALEVGPHYDEPELTIAAMLTVIESLDDSSRTLWNSCTKREFDIGYDCGQISKPLNQRLSAQLLEQVTAIKASLSITLYPEVSSQ